MQRTTPSALEEIADDSAGRTGGAAGSNRAGSRTDAVREPVCDLMRPPHATRSCRFPRPAIAAIMVVRLRAGSDRRLYPAGQLARQFVGPAQRSARYAGSWRGTARAAAVPQAAPGAAVPVAERRRRATSQTWQLVPDKRGHRPAAGQCPGAERSPRVQVADGHVTHPALPPAPPESAWQRAQRSAAGCRTHREQFGTSRPNRARLDNSR